jgi:hypothetical protein
MAFRVTPPPGIRVDSIASTQRRAQSVGDIVSQAPKHRHGRVGVRVDHARHHNPAPRVDRFGRPITRALRGRADGDDPGVIDRHKAVSNRRARRIHRKDEPVRD